MTKTADRSEVRRRANYGLLMLPLTAAMNKARFTKLNKSFKKSIQLVKPGKPKPSE